MDTAVPVASSVTGFKCIFESVVVSVTEVSTWAWMFWARSWSRVTGVKNPEWDVAGDTLAVVSAGQGLQWNCTAEENEYP